MTDQSLLIKQHFVYVFHAQGTPRVKLGVASDVEQRLRQLQTGSPYKLVVLAVWPGSQRLERKLHSHFQLYRKEGEWFELPPFPGKAIWDIVRVHQTRGVMRAVPRPSEQHAPSLENAGLSDLAAKFELNRKKPFEQRPCGCLVPRWKYVEWRHLQGGHRYLYVFDCEGTKKQRKYGPYFTHAAVSAFVQEHYADRVAAFLGSL